MWIRTLRQYTSFNCCTDFAVQYRHTLLIGTSLRTTCGGSCFPHMVLQASSSPRRRSIARASQSEYFASTYTSCAAPSLLTGTFPLSPEKSCCHIISISKPPCKRIRLPDDSAVPTHPCRAAGSHFNTRLCRHTVLNTEYIFKMRNFFHYSIFFYVCQAKYLKKFRHMANTRIQSRCPSSGEYHYRLKNVCCRTA